MQTDLLPRDTSWDFQTQTGERILFFFQTVLSYTHNRESIELWFLSFSFVSRKLHDTQARLGSNVHYIVYISSLLLHNLEVLSSLGALPILHHRNSYFTCPALQLLENSGRYCTVGTVYWLGWSGKEKCMPQNWIKIPAKVTWLFGFFAPDPKTDWVVRKAACGLHFLIKSAIHAYGLIGYFGRKVYQICLGPLVRSLSGV